MRAIKVGAMIAVVVLVLLCMYVVIVSTSEERQIEEAPLTSLPFGQDGGFAEGVSAGYAISSQMFLTYIELVSVGDTAGATAQRAKIIYVLEGRVGLVRANLDVMSGANWPEVQLIIDLPLPWLTEGLYERAMRDLRLDALDTVVAHE